MAPVVKPKVKVAPERRGVKKIWNVSDWPATSVPAQTVVVMGVAVPPGGSVEVPAERLKNAHKTLKDRDAGLIHIGDAPPAEYTTAKEAAPRAHLPRGVTRTHGKGTPAPEEPKASEESKKPEKVKEAPLRNGLVEKPAEEEHKGKGKKERP